VSPDLWTSTEIAAATGGTAHGDFSVDAVTFDSREVIGGELFVAMKGAETDGHRFVASAVSRGAAGCLVSQPIETPHVLVGDGFAALQALGRVARARTDATIIGVTGSVGKTSVKEALKMALTEAAPAVTHASVKSYNNHTGVPLSLARMPADTRFGIFEMGMNHAGELAALTRLVRPNIAIVTAIASAHREFFDSEEAIADAKAEIFEGLEPGGTAILPFDSPHFARLKQHAERYAARILTFGLNEGADVRPLRSAEIDTGTVLQISINDQQIGFTLRQPGLHWQRNSLAVLATAYAAGADLTAAALGLAQMRGLQGRGAQHVINWQGGEVRLLDESYNANDASMRAALEVLRDAPTPGRRIAVLGAIGELGTESEKIHGALAEPIADSGASPVLLLGEEMRPLADEIGAEHLESAAGAEDWLRDTLKAGDTVLIKGSNYHGLSRLVAAFTGADA
jgi:UDP-N-acetylmuramoyl-tripeptide--D-alanyl-D-alanine ligase|tara:strand:+ start:100225 stop:101592 length:1368 start_codon:yes stop_codon:yes gene_type:complete